MEHIRRRDLRALRRRMEFIKHRFDVNPDDDNGRTYDAAEYEALRRVLRALEGTETLE